MSVTPTQADREAAASFFGYDTWQDSQENGGTHGPIISARLAELLAHHAEQARLEEREIAARVCDRIADGWDLRRKGAPNAANAELCAEIATSHRLNAAAIRKGEAHDHA